MIFYFLAYGWKYYFPQELKLTLMTMIKVFLCSLYKILPWDTFLSLFVNIWWHSNCKMRIWYAVKILLQCPTLLNFWRIMVNSLVKLSIFGNLKYGLFILTNIDLHLIMIHDTWCIWYTESWYTSEVPTNLPTKKYPFMENLF